MDSITGISKLFGELDINLRWKMFKKNITFKLTLGFLSIAIVSTLFIGIIALNIFKNNIYEVKKNNMKKHALAISQTIKPYVSNTSNNEEFVKIIHLLNDIDNAKLWILNGDKSIITASDTNDDIKYINDSTVKELYDSNNSKVLEGTETYYDGYNPYYNEDMMTIAVPIKENNNVIGAVILNSSMYDLSNSMNKFFFSLILAVLGESIIVGLLGYYFSRNISKPIKEINAAALELARGQYGIKTNIYQKDEIGELSSSFDLLSLKLKHIISEKEKLEQMRKEFISNVSHEFRTPLTVIKGNLESIVDGMTKPEQVADTCVTLIKETNRLERMVKDLLNLSKLESGKLEIDFNKLDVNMLINDTIRSLKPLIRSKDIELQLSLESSLPTLLSDYDKLKQLIIIFLDNAIKFSENNGILKVTTYKENKNIYIAIKDNGIGIPKDEIQYLGEKFYKIDKARNSNGTGLGLSIAKRLVKVLNGNVSIESELGKGTTITISFSII
jgi:signal transduction histidine kinase